MSTPVPTIRPAAPADIPRLIEIRGAVRENRLSDPGSVTAADYLPYIEAGRCWVAEAEGRVVGFAALDAEGSSVWALFVAPEAEGRGVGRGLMEALVEEARRRGLSALRLETEAGSRAERFYRAAGWSRVDLPAGAGTARGPEGSVVMQRAL
jgi:GNAT superfamily N-acetyltransferase